MRKNVKVSMGDASLPRVLRDDVRETTQRLLYGLTWKARQREFESREVSRPSALSRLRRIDYWALCGAAIYLAGAATLLYLLTRVAALLNGGSK